MVNFHIITPFLDFVSLVSAGMQVYVVICTVVGLQVVLRIIVPKMFEPGRQIYFVLFLIFLIPQTIKLHIYGFGTLMNYD